MKKAVFHSITLVRSNIIAKEKTAFWRQRVQQFNWNFMALEAYGSGQFDESKTMKRDMDTVFILSPGKEHNYAVSRRT